MKKKEGIEKTAGEDKILQLIISGLYSGLSGNEERVEWHGKPLTYHPKVSGNCAVL